jgi:diacylglycerol kinase (ATP)
MAGSSVRVIVNPRAGSGKAERAVPAIERAMARYGLSHEVVRTSGPGDAGRLAARAIDDGVDVIAVVGGDGTINETSQAFVDASGAPRPKIPDLALIPAGTGGDLRKSFGLGHDVDAAVERIAQGTRIPLDFGVMRLTGHAGEPVLRTFVNIASFGFSGVTDKLVNEAPKWMGGTVAFLVGSVRASLGWRNVPVRVRIDEKPWLEGRVFVVAIANGRYFGGGMKIAPTADPSDGRFEIVAIGDIGRVDTYGLSAKIYRGTHVEMSTTKIGACTRVEAEALDGGEVLLDVDGETPGRLPIDVRICSGALCVRV